MIPSITRVRQIALAPCVANVAEETLRLWQASSVAQLLQPGMRVAIALGSRGIANLLAMARATADFVRSRHAIPFVVAGMGSHGGATAEGQRAILASFSVTEESLGVPVRTDMDVASIGPNALGEPVWWDRNALAADAVLAITRIKPHTDFHARIESGIAKMLVIGLGKREGAAQHHRWGLRGLTEFLPASARVVLDKTPFLAALAVIENAREQTARLEVVPRDRVLEREPELLNEARASMGRLPFDQLDLLVIGEIGKNYSGTCIDPNVVGRMMMETVRDLESPRITRLCALDLSPESQGNAIGIGLADLTTERLLAAIDPVPFRANALTACFLGRCKLPLGFATDRECIEAGVATCWQPEPERVRMAIIPNTLEVAEAWVSRALAEEARSQPALEVLEEFRALPFDAAGRLIQSELFPHSIQGRRGRSAAIGHS